MEMHTLKGLIEMVSFQEIGKRLAEAFRLTALPLAVYGSDAPPRGGAYLSEVNRCLAVALYRMATGGTVDTLFLGADRQEGCCLGGLTHMGFISRPEYIRYFVSTGKEGVMGGGAEYLKSSPEMVDRTIEAIGAVTPPGRYLVVQACRALPETDPGVRSICCFGTAEQIRNMAALVHFDRSDPFSPVIVPWGAACATLITYPAGMAAKAPRDSAFMGPQDPTQNHVFPPDALALGIPAKEAERMVQNLDQSFVIRRPQVAFPDH